MLRTLHPYRHDIKPATNTATTDPPIPPVNEGTAELALVTTAPAAPEVPVPEVVADCWSPGDVVAARPAVEIFVVVELVMTITVAVLVAVVVASLSVGVLVGVTCNPDDVIGAGTLGVLPAGRKLKSGLLE